MVTRTPRQAQRAGSARAAGDGEGGFTFVELVVSLTILAVGIVSVVGVTNSSFRVAGESSARSKAVATATKVIEEFRAVPYDELEVLEGSAATVTYDEVVAGRSFTIEKTLVWTAEGVVAEAYKQATVAIRWQEGGAWHEISQSSYIYPGGIGTVENAAAAPDTHSNCMPSTPTALSASRPSDAALQPSTIDLSWAALDLLCPIEAIIIEYSTDAFATPREVTRDATSNSYRLTGLSSNTLYAFRAAARAYSGRVSGWSNIASQSTTSAATACSVGTMTLTPSVVNKRNPSSGSGISVDPVLTVPVQGSCSGFRAVYRPTPTTTRQLVLAYQGGGSWSGTLLGRTITWDVGKRYVDVYDVSTNAQVGAVLLTVCEHNVTCG